jgi:hypothetical protein
MGLDLGLCLQGHTKWVGDFSMLVGVYKDGNRGDSDRATSLLRQSWPTCL